MNKCIMDGFTRVTKKEAEKRFNKGLPVFLCPVKLKPGAPWHPEIMIKKGSEEEKKFIKLLNNFIYYNCSSNEVGYYPAYYIKTV